MPSQQPLFNNMMNMDSQKWFEKFLKRLEGANSPYARELPNARALLRRNHARRYVPL